MAFACCRVAGFFSHCLSQALGTYSLPYFYSLLTNLFLVSTFTQQVTLEKFKTKSEGSFLGGTLVYLQKLFIFSTFLLVYCNNKILKHTGRQRF